MFTRLITGHAEAVAAVVAFAFATSIFVAVAWQTLRIDRGRLERLARLPLERPPADPHP